MTASSLADAKPARRLSSVLAWFVFLFSCELRVRFKDCFVKKEAGWGGGGGIRKEREGGGGVVGSGASLES